MSTKTNNIYIVADGGSKGNGTANQQAYGSFAVIFKKNVKRIERFEFGDGTNNQAEYCALLEAVKYASNLVESCKYQLKITFAMDSELVVGSMKGEKKLKKAHLKELKELVDSIWRDDWTIMKIDREKVVKYLGH